MNVTINQHPLEHDVEGQSSPADNGVLLATSYDLTAGNSWAASGYTVAPFLAPSAQKQLKEGLAELVREALRATGLPVASDFAVERYHEMIGDDQARHLAVIQFTREYPVSRLPVPVQWLEERVAQLCGSPVAACNPYDAARLFHLRIIRPGRSDNNPLHRDVWLPNYADCINIYLPVAGSTIDSSLSLVPGSHWWPENQTERTQQGAIYKGALYRVPGVKGSTANIQLIRPNPNPDEVLLFSPYLLHGGAVNLTANLTRVSLEMRFWPA
ncbi:phytanoyl-CoA dioxygenase family protein [Hymenobacter yonginensis]|uniref:Phytanoyl-CoA dioxygenase n=1 Tax=Hymenobacter yonginensis TaxID=748197 RepID=A0ABY7PSV3_9BACT|nr:hypothetical protein [Hymenobacter yonginensis]WBO85684.1 hypothetical protein O9Z63_05410 [Hymenobacter yonginensis]